MLSILGSASIFNPVRKRLSSLVVLIGFAFPAVIAVGLAAEPELPGIDWPGPEGQTVHFSDLSAFEDFLRTAEVVAMKELGKGVTRPKKVLLEKEGVKLNAVFRTVDYHKRRWQSARGLKMDFVDRYTSECAAYEVAKLMGIDNIPPVVLRKIGKEDGSLQAWVENALNEDDRLARKIEVPDKRRWFFQVQVVRLFDNLIYNDDRNQGNILFDPAWKLWMIDQTRAFQTVPFLKDVSQLHVCERRFWERLNALDEEVLKERLVKPGLLSEREIRTLLVRRDELVKYIKKLIEENGERNVLVALN